MLSVRDFVNFSLTCRVLHWRIFTFCTCYAPYRVQMHVQDDRIFAEFWDRTKSIPPREQYYLFDGSINYENENDGFGDHMTFYDFGRGQTSAIRLYSVEQEGRRGLFIYQPFCLRKPFFFETLELYLHLPFYGKKYYDRCLPYILAVRYLARHLNLSIVYQCSFRQKPFFNFPDTNDFLKAINANYYNQFDAFRLFSYPDEMDEDSISNMDIYVNCPYARRMDRVVVSPSLWNQRLNVPVFANSIGEYHSPVDRAIMATLKNVLTGSINLDFHQYYEIEMDNNNKYPLLEYLFEKFGEFEEFLSTERGDGRYYDYHFWKKTVATENGGQLRVEIKKATSNYFPYVMIGKEKTFDEMKEKYMNPRYRRSGMWWKMETAVEPDED